MISGVIPVFGDKATVGGSSFTYQDGSVSVSTAATGVQTAAVAFTPNLAVGVDLVLFGVRNLPSGAVVGVPYTTGESTTGLTINVDVTTAATGSVTVSYMIVGH